MNNVVVDIADMKISTNPEETLITYSLGSCLGITAYDPLLKIGGMMHCMLPMSKIDKEKARIKPYMFVDTGMVIFLQKLFELGVQKSRMELKVAGGAQVLETNNLFRIGERNFTVLRKILWKNGIMINADDVGGKISRTVKLNIDSGQFTIKSKGIEREL